MVLDNFMISRKFNIFFISINILSLSLILFFTSFIEKLGEIESISDIFTIFGSYSGLFSQYVILLSFIFSSRFPLLESKLGLDISLLYHRITGEVGALLFLLHIIFEFLSSITTFGFFNTIISFTSTAPYMTLASISGLLFFFLIISSLKFIRRTLNYETWYFLHLLIYPIVILSLFHQIKLGIDFSTSTVKSNFWLGFIIIIILSSLYYRYKSLFLSFINQSFVVEKSYLSSNIVNLSISSKDSSGYVGKFVFLRFLNKDLWWKSHPFSVSFTDSEKFSVSVKNLGLGSSIIHNVRVGEKVIIEGPYGRLNYQELVRSKVLFIGVGIGIAPIAPFIDHLKEDSQPIFILRTRVAEELQYIENLENKVNSIGGTIHKFIGPRGSYDIDPLSFEELAKLVPDIKERQIVIYGPENYIYKIVRVLRKLDISHSQIHYERIYY